MNLQNGKKSSSFCFVICQYSLESYGLQEMKDHWNLKYEYFAEEKKK